MSFENLLDDEDREERELDPRFLQSYSYGRSTLSLPDEAEVEDEEDEEYELLGLPPDQDADLEWERLVQEAEREEIKDATQRLQSEEKRRERREYQQRYRKGLIAPKKAKTVERNAGNGKKEKRKKLAYYLPVELANTFLETVDLLGVKRRVFIQTALEDFFATRPTIRTIAAPRPGANLKFMYDEIPESLWNKVAILCRDKEGKRVANYYQVVEAALVKALKSV